MIPKRLLATIHTICSDMWEGYINAITEFISEHEAVKANLISDRFHVAKLYRDCVETIRKSECRRLKKELDESEYRKVAYRIHWILRRNYTSLNTEDKQRLRLLFRETPDLHQAYTLREELTAIFNMKIDFVTGKKRLLAWAEKAERLATHCFDSFIKLLRARIDIIANYFRRRANSGFVEGLNTKLKLITRRSYGLKRADSLFQRLWLDTAGYKRFI